MGLNGIEMIKVVPKQNIEDIFILKSSEEGVHLWEISRDLGAASEAWLDVINQGVDFLETFNVLDSWVVSEVCDGIVEIVKNDLWICVSHARLEDWFVIFVGNWLHDTSIHTGNIISSDGQGWLETQQWYCESDDNLLHIYY